MSYNSIKSLFTGDEIRELATSPHVRRDIFDDIKDRAYQILGERFGKERNVPDAPGSLAILVVGAKDDAEREHIWKNTSKEFINEVYTGKIICDADQKEISSIIEKISSGYKTSDEDRKNYRWVMRRMVGLLSLNMAVKWGHNGAYTVPSNGVLSAILENADKIGKLEVYYVDKNSISKDGKLEGSLACTFNRGALDINDEDAARNLRDFYNKYPAKIGERPLFLCNISPALSLAASRPKLGAGATEQPTLTS
ncbi:MAG: hypothetical protein PHX43_07400 [Alphaproteobacteria bacterium]|nr:hypothetical protein [Alphaproteobacteria bacterium]